MVTYESAPDLSQYPKFSREQIGHLRHIHNLASQPDGEWRHMGSQEPLQEFLDAHRYQLATMFYAAGAAHFHHQPVLRSVYKNLLQKLLNKMLLRSVWSYWFNASLGGIATNPDMKELRKPWADPIQRENIMYSGHLLLMVAMFGMLFDDDKYEQPDSMEFVWDPTFFGMGTEVFKYNAQSLQDAIISEMEKNKWTGVCCEPNLVFVVCNQFPLIGIRLRDARNRTAVVDTILKQYVAAWEEKGISFKSGELLPDSWMVEQDRLRLPKDLAWTAWGCAFMHAWNGDAVSAMYEKQSLGFITNIDGEVRLNQPAVGVEFRRLVEQGASSSASSTLQQAREKAQHDMVTETAKKKHFPYTKPTFGYVAQWLSELGRPELASILQYADNFLKPTWEDGGLYYPRNDQAFDDELNWTHMDPFTGNAAIAYARFNVADGMRKMWESPWTAKDLSRRPYVENLTLDEVDVLRGIWDKDRHLLLVTVRAWTGKAIKVKPRIIGLAAGEWSVWVDGDYQARSVEDYQSIELEVDVSGQDIDIVVVRA